MILFTSCNMEPKYEVPTLPVSEQWKNSSLERVEPDLTYENWWNVFNAPYLSDIIQQAISNNQDLRQHTNESSKLELLQKSRNPNYFLNGGRSFFLGGG